MTSIFKCLICYKSHLPTSNHFYLKNPFIGSIDNWSSHITCEKMIEKPIEKIKLYTYQVFEKDESYQFHATTYAKHAVEKQCFSRISIEHYIKKYGEDNLNLLFENNGIQAVDEWKILFEINQTLRIERLKKIEELFKAYKEKYEKPFSPDFSSFLRSHRINFPVN